MGGRFHMLKWCPYQMSKRRKSHTAPPRTKQDILREWEEGIRKGTLGGGGMVETAVTTPTRGPECFCLGFLPADPAAAGRVQTLHLSQSLLARWCTTRTWEKEVHGVLTSPRSVWVGASTARTRQREAEGTGIGLVLLSSFSF